MIAGEPALIDAAPLPRSASAARSRSRASWSARCTSPACGYYATCVGAADPRRRLPDRARAPSDLRPDVARQLDEMWQRLGRPGDFVLREYGAGSGALVAGHPRRPERIESPIWRASSATTRRPARASDRRRGAHGRGRACRLLMRRDVRAPCRGLRRWATSSWTHCRSTGSFARRRACARSTSTGRTTRFVEVAGELSDPRSRGVVHRRRRRAWPTASRQRSSLAMLDWLRTLEPAARARLRPAHRLRRPSAAICTRHSGRPARFARSAGSTCRATSCAPSGTRTSPRTSTSTRSSADARAAGFDVAGRRQRTSS